MIAAAPMFMNELTVLMIAAATPEKTIPASSSGVKRRRKNGEPTRAERAADALVHKTLLTVKLPALYLNPRLPRRSDWYDSGESGTTMH